MQGIVALSSTVTPDPIACLNLLNKYNTVAEDCDYTGQYCSSDCLVEMLRGQVDMAVAGCPPDIFHCDKYGNTCEGELGCSGVLDHKCREVCPPPGSVCSNGGSCIDGFCFDSGESPPENFEVQNAWMEEVLKYIWTCSSYQLNDEQSIQCGTHITNGDNLDWTDSERYCPLFASMGCCAATYANTLGVYLEPDTLPDAIAKCDFSPDLSVGAACVIPVTVAELDVAKFCFSCLSPSDQGGATCEKNLATPIMTDNPSSPIVVTCGWDMDCLYQGICVGTPWKEWKEDEFCERCEAAESHASAECQGLIRSLDRGGEGTAELRQACGSSATCLFHTLLCGRTWDVEAKHEMCRKCGGLDPDTLETEGGFGECYAYERLACAHFESEGDTFLFCSDCANVDIPERRAKCVTSIQQQLSISWCTPKGEVNDPEMCLAKGVESFSTAQAEQCDNQAGRDAVWSEQRCDHECTTAHMESHASMGVAGCPSNTLDCIQIQNAYADGYKCGTEWDQMCHPGCGEDSDCTDQVGWGSCDGGMCWSQLGLLERGVAQTGLLQLPVTRARECALNEDRITCFDLIMEMESPENWADGVATGCSLLQSFGCCLGTLVELYGGGGGRKVGGRLSMLQQLCPDLAWGSTPACAIAAPFTDIPGVTFCHACAGRGSSATANPNSQTQQDEVRCRLAAQPFFQWNEAEAKPCTTGGLDCGACDDRNSEKCVVAIAYWVGMCGTPSPSRGEGGSLAGGDLDDVQAWDPNACWVTAKRACGFSREVDYGGAIPPAYCPICLFAEPNAAECVEALTAQHALWGCGGAAFSVVASSWSECSSNCKTGYQTRTVECVNDVTGYKAPLDACVDAPAVTKIPVQACTPTCEEGYRLIYSPWSHCSRPCWVPTQPWKQPVRTRSEECWRTSDGAEQLVEVEDCVEKGGLSLEPTMEECNRFPCVENYWRTGELEDCPAPCGGDFATRPVDCMTRELRDIEMVAVKLREIESCNRNIGYVPVSEKRCNTKPCPEQFCDLHADCQLVDQAGLCLVGEDNHGYCQCSTEHFWGEFCTKSSNCPSGVYERHKGTTCCESGILDNKERCCDPGHGLDRKGKCCEVGLLDACNVCEGDAKYVDVVGRCCPGELDAGGVCCESGNVDLCGVCDESSNSCSVQVVLIMDTGGWEYGERMLRHADIMDVPFEDVSVVGTTVADRFQLTARVSPPWMGVEKFLIAAGQTQLSGHPHYPGLMINDVVSVTPEPVCGNRFCEIGERCLPGVEDGWCCPDDCHASVPECPTATPDPCSGHGTCLGDLSLEHTAVCKCDRGFTGKECNDCDGGEGYVSQDGRCIKKLASDDQLANADSVKGGGGAPLLVAFLGAGVALVTVGGGVLVKRIRAEEGANRPIVQGHQQEQQPQQQRRQRQQKRQGHQQGVGEWTTNNPMRLRDNN